ncbi:MAG TPA: HAMP domain-containing sensor histidine kinase [Verrucomicrobiae bacterium]|nr:HAMP domain-containing sensor histidine kinase [Verrucomicrobiae bacterium]
MKRPRLPLYGQILLWFFVNLAVVGLGLALLVRAQLNLGLDSLLGGNAGDRLVALGRAVAGELRGSPREEWDGTLERLGSAYGVSLSLRSPAGDPIAGFREPLPPRIMEVMRRRLPVPPPPPPGKIGMEPPQPGWQPRPRPDEGPVRPGPFEPGPPPREGVQKKGGRALPELHVPPGPVGRPTFFARDGDPPKYWAGVPLTPGADHRFGGGSLLIIASPSLAAGGLFFEPGPWVLGGLAVIAVSALVWVPFVRRVTRRLGEMTRATERVAEGHFDGRVESGGGDELSRLAEAINRMSARLGNLVQGQRRFLGDIAHELCSPLARAQMAIGVFARKATPESRGAIADAEEEMEQLSGLVGELLSFSKAALRPDAVPRSAVELRPLVEAVVRREAKGCDARIEVPEGLSAEANEEMLSRALANVLRNAVRHAAADGPIVIRAEYRDDAVELRVQDLGPGIPGEMLERVFEPFFRPEEARTRETGGAGLGLAIARTCLGAFGASIACRNRQPRGLEVIIRMTRGAAGASRGG